MKGGINHACGADILEDREFPNGVRPDTVPRQGHDPYEEIEKDHCRTSAPTGVKSNRRLRFDGFSASCPIAARMALRKAGRPYWASTRARAAAPMAWRRAGSTSRSAT